MGDCAQIIKQLNSKNLFEPHWLEHNWSIFQTFIPKNGSRNGFTLIHSSYARLNELLLFFRTCSKICNKKLINYTTSESQARIVGTLDWQDSIEFFNGSSHSIISHELLGRILWSISLMVSKNWLKCRIMNGYSRIVFWSMKEIESHNNLRNKFSFCPQLSQVWTKVSRWAKKLSWALHSSQNSYRWLPSSLPFMKQVI